MSRSLELPQRLKIVNIGLPAFAEHLALVGADVVHVDWKPPAGGDPTVLRQLDRLSPLAKDVAKANQEAFTKLVEARPFLVDVVSARDALPDLPPRTVLHAGPPVRWEDMAGPMKGAVTGALLLEGWAATPEEAERLASSGEINFEPCHHWSVVGPMAGVVCPSMAVVVVENRADGNRAYSPLNEGLGKVLRFGAYDAAVLERLRWINDMAAPILREAVRAYGDVDLDLIAGQALQMGDECHNRNKAASALFLREMAPRVVRLNHDSDTLFKVCRYLAENEHFYLSLSMASCKSALDAASGVRLSSLVTVMARNGTEFGIQVSGLGREWMTAAALPVDGLYFPGFGAADASLDLGDSAITETAGLGGFAMACAPAMVKFVGGTPADAQRHTQRMYGITVGESPKHLIPGLDFRGTPTGIDFLKVLEADTLPIINTGIAHRDPGVGQIGAGIVNAPRECFLKALGSFVERYAEGGCRG